MYSILIADDKTIIRKGLIKMIDWKALGLELAGEAENGNRAVEIIAQKKPDIVITDICMPDCDGVSLLNSIAAEYPDIKTIVVSGYDNFEYARTALKCGSLDYLLKPVDPAELNRVIKNACTGIKSDKKDDSAANNESALYKLILDRENSETGLFPQEDCYFSVAIFRSSENFGALKEIDKEIKNLYAFKGVFSLLDSRELSAVFFDFRDKEEAAFNDKVFYTVSNKLILPLSAPGLITGIGKTAGRYSDIGDSYNSACESACYALVNKEDCIFSYNRNSQYRFINIPIEKFESALEAGVIAGNLESIKAILKNLYDNYFLQPEISLDCIRLAISKLCYIIIRFDIGLSRKIQEFLDRISGSRTLFDYGRIENIEKVITEFYISAIEWFREDKNVKYSTCKRIRGYIEKNYASDISLKSIAGHFHLNPSYLSFLFKQEMNENLNEYINRIRIENAQRILEAGDGRISQISQLVGFTNDNYFYKVFKRVTGLTPGEFQKTQKKDRK
jgi:two-component system response regulator YesN